MLDNTRLRGELAHIHRTLSGVAAGLPGKRLLDELRRGLTGTTAALLWQALFADCLRVTHSAVAADGVLADDEIEAVYEFLFSVARHYASVLPARYAEFDAIDHDEARPFLRCYADDQGPFGHGAVEPWPGLRLCRRAAELGETEALERYERMMSWLMSAVCQIGAITDEDPRWRGRVAELVKMRDTLARSAEVSAAAVDLRVQAFLAPSAVFSSVQHGSSIYEADPFDVESIHRDARETFEDMIERATADGPHSDRGRMLLVLGDSGSGKTHLLRGFRRHVHEYGRGFVAYAQLHSASDDYARYLLQHVVNSLARPYSGPSGERTGLYQLASGLPLLVGEPLKSQVDRLVDESWESPDRTASLADYVNSLVDNLLRHGELSSFDPDLLRVLLYALHPDQRTTSSVYKYLRCEAMNPHDRRWIGEVVPRTDKGDPGRMIRELGRLAYVTRHASLVLMLDQAEQANFGDSSILAFQRAIDTLQGITTEVPSVVAVVACLSDLYKEVSGKLSKFALDRLERDPPIAKLQINRSAEDIDAIVGRRLSWLFAKTGAVYRPETPGYPIPASLLRSLVNRRTRDILDACYQFQMQCAAAGKLIDGDELFEADGEVEPEKPTYLAQLAAAWNDAMHASGIEIPDEDEQIQDLVIAAGRACAEELGLAVSPVTVKNGVSVLKLTANGERVDIAIAVTNRSYQRGSFTSQIDNLRRTSRAATAVAVRTIEFPRGPACDRAMAGLMKAGGRRAYLDASTLRALVAFQHFAPPFAPDQVAQWRRRDRPISSLPAIGQIYDLEGLAEPPVVAAVAADVPATSSQPGTAAEPARQPEPPLAGHVDRATMARGSAPVPTMAAAPAAWQAAVTPAGEPPSTTSSPDLLHIGATSGFRATPQTIELRSMLRHTGVLGSSGSGKTTLALNLVEQALERDVAVVILDRKGDLAGYAKDGWWQHTAAPERAHRLAERLDVRLFTPGTRGGRPLSLSAVPDLDQVPEHERDRMVQYAAQALAAMMRFGEASTDTARLAILTQAIDILAERKATGGLPELIALLEDRDDALIARAGRYDDRLFKRLLQDLETVRLNDDDLFDPAAEALTAETLIGRNADGKVPLAIVSTRFLGEIERIQSWAAHLIACLSRHVAKAPSSQLHTLFMIDEADLYMPAGATKPPCKEPLQDLLKRARAAGLGVVLASQSPADFDYRSREQISTWFLGRIADRRSIDKMKPLFEHRPAIGGKLATLEVGRFVMLQDGAGADLERAPSLLRTEQLAEDELMALAAQTRARRAAPPATAPARGPAAKERPARPRSGGLSP